MFLVKPPVIHPSSPSPGLGRTSPVTAALCTTQDKGPASGPSWQMSATDAVFLSFSDVSNQKKAWAPEISKDLLQACLEL